MLALGAVTSDVATETAADGAVECVGAVVGGARRVIGSAKYARAAAVAARLAC